MHGGEGGIARNTGGSLFPNSMLLEAEGSL